MCSRLEHEEQLSKLREELATTGRRLRDSEDVSKELVEKRSALGASNEALQAERTRLVELEATVKRICEENAALRSQHDSLHSVLPNIPSLHSFLLPSPSLFTLLIHTFFRKLIAVYCYL